TVVATATIDEEVAAGVIARLAVLANVDPSTPALVTGATRVRRGDRACDLVVMIRGGHQPRAELVLAGARRSTDAMIDLTPGDVVDRYRVVARIGSGGMGRVYRVEHELLGRVYALKVLHREIAERDPRSVDRFVREARAASRIHHPNIVDVFDF